MVIYPTISMFRLSLCFLSMLLACGAYAKALTEALATKPNIIFILTDDHGYADLGCQGIVDDVKTPFIDELAAGGARMTHGYSTAPQCSPSRAGLMTGRYQTRFNFESNADGPLPFDETTVATYLKDAGYITCHTGKWHLQPTHQNGRWVLGQMGMDVSSMSPDEIHRELRKIPRKEINQIVGPSVGKYMPYQRGFIYSKENNFTNIGYDGKPMPRTLIAGDGVYHLDGNNLVAANFIREHAGEEPFFLYVAHTAPHVPLDVTEKYLERFPRELVGDMPERRRRALAMISCMDDGVGMILSALREKGIEENTLIFFMSDNGAPYKMYKEDKPGVGPGWDGSLNDPWLGEKGSVMEGALHLPYLVYWKGTIPAGQVYEEPVITLDATATALELAGVTPAKPLDGVNLMPYLTGSREGAPHEALYWRWGGQVAVRAGDWKYLELGAGKGEFLFNITTEEHEANNLIENYPERAERLKQKLHVWLDEQVPAGLNRGPSGQAIDYYNFFLDAGIQ